ncbi:hypothetical protein BCR33DRAFT_724535, partial [Rhizoclosmatium globosum]
MMFQFHPAANSATTLWLLLLFHAFQPLAKALTILSPNENNTSVFYPNETFLVSFLPTNEPTYQTEWTKVFLEPGHTQVYYLQITNSSQLGETVSFNLTAPAVEGNYSIVFFDRVYLEPSIRTSPEITGLSTAKAVTFVIRNVTSSSTQTQASSTDSG